MMLELELTKNLPLSAMSNPPRGLRAKANLLHDSDFGIGNKKEINKIMAKKMYGLEIPDVCNGYIEYKMSKTMAENILRDNKGKGNPQKALCDFVNTQMGIKGYCVRVIVENN